MARIHLNCIPFCQQNNRFFLQKIIFDNNSTNSTDEKPFNFKNKIKSVKALGQKDLVLGEIDGFWFLATDLTFPVIIEVENTKGEKAQYTYTEAHTDLVDTDNLI